MEFWLIVSKLIVFIYIVFSYIYLNVANLPWIILTLLLYLSVNVLISICKKIRTKHINFCIDWLSYVIYMEDSSVLYFVLPLNLYEIIFRYIEKKWQLFLIMMIPIIFTNESIRMTYGLIVAFSFLVLTMAERYILRVLKLESQNDQMRKDMQRLTKSLNENKEYIRQSEYTFKLEEKSTFSRNS